MPPYLITNLVRTSHSSSQHHHRLGHWRFLRQQTVLKRTILHLLLRLHNLIHVGSLNRISVRDSNDDFMPQHNNSVIFHWRIRETCRLVVIFRMYLREGVWWLTWGRSLGVDTGCCPQTLSRLSVPWKMAPLMFYDVGLCSICLINFVL